MKRSSSLILAVAALSASGVGSKAQESIINQTLLGTNNFTQQNSIDSTSVGVTAIAGGSQGAGVSLNQIGDHVTLFQAGAVPLTITQGIGDSQSGASFNLNSTNNMSSSSLGSFGFAVATAPQTSLNQGNVVHIGIASGGTLNLSQTAAATAGSSSTSANTLSSFGVFGSAGAGGFPMSPTMFTASSPSLQQALSSFNAATLNIGGTVRVQLDQNGSPASYTSTNSAAAGVTTGTATLSSGTGTPVSGSISVSSGLSSSAQTWLNSFLSARTVPTYQTITVGTSTATR